MNIHFESKQQRALQRISELMTSFVQFIRIESAVRRFDINLHAENILKPILAVTYGLEHIENLNVAGGTFPGVDLGDKKKRVAVQVTSTNSRPKLIHTLEQFVSNKQYEDYDRLILYLILEKHPNGYDVRSVNTAIAKAKKDVARVAPKHLFDFDLKRDILDYTDLVRDIDAIEIGRILRIEEILEEHFGSKAEEIKRQKEFERTFLQRQANSLRDGLKRLQIAGERAISNELNVYNAFFMLKAQQIQITNESQHANHTQQEQEEAKPLDFMQALAEEQRLVIVSDPGAGKTSSLLYLASQLTAFYGQSYGDQTLFDTLAISADEALSDALQNNVLPYIPVYLPLADDAARTITRGKRRGIPKAIEQKIVENATAEEGAAAGSLVTQWVRNKQVWLLMDGLDEVSSGLRQDVVKMVKGFAETNPDLPLTITSRPVGEPYHDLVKDNSAVGSLKLFRLLALENQDTQLAFTQNWLEAYAQNRPMQTAEEIITYCKGKGRLYKVLRNPLLLHMMVQLFVHKKTGSKVDLPSSRTDLYEQFMRLAYGRIPGEEVGDYDYYSAMQLLEHIAWFMQGPTGEQGETTNQWGSITKRSLIVKLKAYFPEEEDLGDWLDFLSDKLRILVCYRDNDRPEKGLVFRFNHRTFQEYFVSRLLARKWSADQNTGREWVWKQVLQPRLLSEGWQEILLMLGTLVGRQNENNALEQGEWFFAQVEKAASLLMPSPVVENQDEKSAPKQGEWFAAALAEAFSPSPVQSLLDAMIGEGVPGKDERVQSLGRNLLLDGALSSSGNDERIFGLVLEALVDDPDESVRWRAAKALGKFGNPRAIDYLFQTLDADRNERVRWQAIIALTTMRHPQATDGFLKTLAENHTVTVRQRAAEALGRIGDRRAIDGLLKALNDDQNEYVRGNAAEALGRIGDPRAIDGLLRALTEDTVGANSLRAAKALGRINKTRTINDLLKILANDPNELARWRAAEALGRIGDPRAINGLLKILVADDSVRRAAVGALGRIGAPRAIDDLLKVMANDEDWYVRRQVAKALGRIGDPRAIDSLLKLLAEEKVESVWNQAVVSLGEIGEPQAINSLLKLLAENQNKSMRRRAAVVLGKTGEPQAIDGLLKTLAEDEFEGVRSQAAKALGVIREPQAVDGLLKALADDQNEYVRRAAAEALGAIGEPQAIDGLLKALAEDEFERVRGKAGMALGKIGEPQAVDGLLKALAEDEFERVRGKAGMALGKIGEPQAVDGLLKALADDQNEYVRRAAAEALGVIRESQAIDGLLKALADDQNEYVRGDAAEALGAIGEPQAIGSLMKALAEDEVGEVRLEAAVALGKIGDPQAVDGLLKALAKDQKMFVRKRAASALGMIGERLPLPDLSTP